ncbi:hypothetical protein [Streptomyces mesophilus]
MPASQRDRWFDELEHAGIDPWQARSRPNSRTGAGCRTSQGTARA